MAGKKTRRSLDSLRGDIQELAESFAAFRDLVATQQAAAAAERQQHSHSEKPVMSAYKSRGANEDGAGFITLEGHFDARPETGSHRDYTWLLDRKPIEEVLAPNVVHLSQRLAAIGHPQRLSILLMLLNGPASANDVVAELSFGTTGAAYHHLNVLQSAGLVEQKERGTFSLIPQQAPVLLTILAALSDNIAVQITTPDDVSTSRDEADDD